MAYTLHHQTPSAGYISWANVHIVYNGVDHTITDGNTNLMYVWWDATNPTVLQTSATYPSLSQEDALVFINRNGVGISVLDSSVTDGGLIVPGTITAEAIAAGAIVTNHLAAGAITTDKIAANAVTTGKIAAGSVTAGKIAVGAVGADQIAANAITADKLAANSVSASKLSVTDPTNFVENWDFELGDTGWTNFAGGWSISNEPGYAGSSWVMKRVAINTNTARVDNTWQISVQEGDSIFIRGKIKSTLDAGAGAKAIGVVTDSGTVHNVAFTTDTPEDWIDVSGFYKVPAGVKTLKVCCRTVNQVAGSTVWFDNIEMRRGSAVLIEDGAITANKMAANSITAANGAIADLAVTNAKIANVDAAKITTGYLSAARIEAGSITSDKISVTSLSALSANLGTITSGTVTGATIRTAASGARVQLTSTNGIEVFNATTRTAHLNKDGSGYIGITNPISWNSAGVVTVPGTLISGEIVGNTIKTATSGWRVELQNSGYPIRVWNGTSTVFSVSDAGAVAMNATLTAGGITLNGGAIKSGQTAFNTGTGFWLGNDAGTPKFSIGNSAGDKLTWDGTNLGITGDILIDANNYWKKSNNTFKVGDTNGSIAWDGSSLIVRTLKTSTGAGQRIELNPSGDNELHFYGNRGDGTVEELATIGITTIGGDSYVAIFGSNDSDHVGVYSKSNSSMGVVGVSNSSGGVYGVSTSSYGVRGESNSSSGVYGSSILSYGVQGISINSSGVVGVSTSSYGVYGSSDSSSGVVGVSNSLYGVQGYSTSSSGVYGYSFSSFGVEGSSNSSSGVFGISIDGAGIEGYGNNYYGAKISTKSTTKGALLIVPKETAEHPTSGEKGALYVDLLGVLWYHDGTAWRKVVLD